MVAVDGEGMLFWGGVGGGDGRMGVRLTACLFRHIA